MEIKHINIEIKGNEIKMTVDEARALWEELNKLFQLKLREDFWPQTWPVTNPLVTCKSDESV